RRGKSRTPSSTTSATSFAGCTERDAPDSAKAGNPRGGAKGRRLTSTDSNSTPWPPGLLRNRADWNALEIMRTRPVAFPSFAAGDAKKKTGLQNLRSQNWNRRDVAEAGNPASLFASSGTNSAEDLFFSHHYGVGLLHIEEALRIFACGGHFRRNHRFLH